MYLKAAACVVVIAMAFPGVRHRVRYFVSFFLYACVMFFGSILYSIKFALKGKPTYENSCDFANVYRCARWVMRLQPRIYGLETYDPEQQCVFVSNHQSFIDVLTMADIWKLRCTVIGKDTLKYFGPLGAILYYTKTILIHRSDHAKAVAEMKRTADLLVQDKASLFMFPEGTRNDSGRLLPFKKGAFHLAIQTQLPIQPLVVSCYNSFLNHKKRWFNPAPYSVYLLPAIPTKGMTEADVQTLVENTFNAMTEVYDKTAKASVSELADDLRKKAD